MLDVKKIKEDFKVFSYNPGYIYLDSTATSLKPSLVTQTLDAYYNEHTATIHRGVYRLSELITKKYEDARSAVAAFIHASRSEEIVFTRNTTESINLIAYSLGRQIIEEGDEIVTSVMEHHSNFVPWQQLAFENGAVFKVIDIDDEGKLNIKNQKSKNGDIISLDAIIRRKTKILAITYVSNALGVINQVKEIIVAAKKINPQVITVVDAAQAAPHIKIDVQDLNCDFLVFSGHKMLGPTGTGILYGKYEILDRMDPFLYGGDMISEVTLEKTTFQKPPSKFEAGTPAIGEVLGLHAAIDYLNNLGLDAIHNHELSLVSYAHKVLTSEFRDTIKIVSSPDEDRGGVVTFTFKNYHPHDVAQILDEEMIAIRAGHHCAMPLHKRLGLQASCRASFYIYNDKSDVEKLVQGLKKVEKILK